MLILYRNDRNVRFVLFTKTSIVTIKEKLVSCWIDYFQPLKLTSSCDSQCDTADCGHSNESLSKAVSLNFPRAFFTIRKRSCGKVMFSQACVKNSVHGEKGVHSPSPGQTPPADTPLWADTCLWADPPYRHAHADTLQPRQTPQGRHPLGRPPTSSNTQGQTHSPWADNPLHPPDRRLMQRTVRIMLDCILVLG